MKQQREDKRERAQEDNHSRANSTVPDLLSCVRNRVQNIYTLRYLGTLGRGDPIHIQPTFVATPFQIRRVYRVLTVLTHVRNLDAILPSSSRKPSPRIDAEAMRSHPIVTRPPSPCYPYHNAGKSIIV